MLFTVSKPSYYKPAHNKVSNNHAGVFRPKVNVVETTDDFQLQMLVPGWNRADLSVKVEENVLTITSEKTWEKGEDLKVTYKEFELGTFRRRFVLPENIDQETISATVNDGILSVTLKKKAVFKRQIEVV